MKKTRLLALVLILALLFVGCAKAPSGNLSGNAMGAPEEGNGIYGEGEKVETSVGIEENRKLIRTVNMEAETSDLDAILADLDAQLAQLGGYVQEKSVQNGRNGSYRYATLTLRIPADKVDQFVSHVEDATNILSSSEKAEDVTLKYSAVESRMKALETKEARLLELLAAAKDLNDLLLLENQLATVRQELETVKSQLKLYDSLIDYGTIHLTVTEVKEFTVVEEEEPTAWERISTGFVKSLKGVWTILTEIFIFLVVALPYLVIPGGIVIAILVIRKNRNHYRPPRNFRKTPAPEQPKEE
jgi:hypothetical protein